MKGKPEKKEELDDEEVDDFCVECGSGGCG